MNLQGETIGRIFIGLVIVLVGGVLLANNLGLAPVVSVGRFWPVILILMGIGSIARPGHRRGGAWLLFLGGLFLLHTFDFFRLDQSWPLFIVALGAGIVWRGVAPARACGRGACTCVQVEK